MTQRRIRIQRGGGPRGVIFSFRLTVKEYVRIERIARRARRPVGDVIRQALRGIR